ncbi:MAG: hypothetical protein JW840_09110 [Candidatus Thermoplasmatota archaeon]|nr:hypothetical protein [Candidatus Thermoplasmatota archaeon]
MTQVLPYISGLYNLIWIVIGFIVTLLLSFIIPRERIDAIMKKIGLILLFFFVPVLFFRIFFNTTFGIEQISFSVVVCITIFFMYILAFMYASHKTRYLKQSDEIRTNIIKTILTNQGRSSAFIGGAMLAIPEWSVEAGLYMALLGIVLFAFVPYILAHFHKKETQQKQSSHQQKSLPWYLKLYPWYLIGFLFAAVGLHALTGLTTADFGDAGVVLQFYSALTVPAALYYVGAGIHPKDLKRTELLKLLRMGKKRTQDSHWGLVRSIVFLTIIVTPLLTLIILIPLLLLDILSKNWFAVLVINAFLPITSTNMFLVPYGIDKRVTAHVVTWTTLICVPVVVVLIYLFSVHL